MYWDDYDEWIDYYNGCNNTFCYWPKGQKLYRPRWLEVQDGQLGVISRYIEAQTTDMAPSYNSDNFFTPLVSVEQFSSSAWSSGTGGLHIQSFFFPNGSLNPLPTGCASGAYAIFSEDNTNTKFALYLPSLLYCDANGNISGFFAGAASFSFYEFHNGNVTFHYIVNDTRDKTAILRSEVFNNIFNFYNELQRS